MGGVSRMGLKLCQHRFQHVSLPMTNFYEKRPPGTPKFLVIFDQIAMCHFWPENFFLTNHGWRSDGAETLSASCLARQKAPVKS